MKPADITAAARSLGSRGGKASRAALTAEERRESARKASRARWGDVPRCPCGAMTAARARKRGHKCG